MMILDRLGNKFPSVAHLCECYGLSLYDYYLEIERYPVLFEDRFGNVFRRQNDFRSVYGVAPRKLLKLREESPSEFEAFISGFSEESLHFDLFKINYRCYDEEGVAYADLKEMCKAKGIPVKSFMKKLKEGLALSEALSNDTNLVYEDHNGVAYESLDAMCATYGITPVVYNERLRAGNTLQNVLTGEYLIKRRLVRDHKGTTYKSFEAMYKTYGISRHIFHERQRHFGSLEYCLTGVDSSGSACVHDHLGNEYRTALEMAFRYGLSYNVVRQRIKRGDTLESALTIRDNQSKSKSGWHFGIICCDIKYSYVIDFVRHWNVVDRYVLDTIIRDKTHSKTRKLSTTDLDKLTYMFEGQRFSGLTELCEKLSLSRTKLIASMREGMSFEDAIASARLRAF